LETNSSVIVTREKADSASRKFNPSKRERCDC